MRLWYQASGTIFCMPSRQRNKQIIHIGQDGFATRPEITRRHSSAEVRCSWCAPSCTWWHHAYSAAKQDGKIGKKAQPWPFQTLNLKSFREKSSSWKKDGTRNTEAGMIRKNKTTFHALRLIEKTSCMQYKSCVGRDTLTHFRLKTCDRSLSKIYRFFINHSDSSQSIFIPAHHFVIVDMIFVSLVENRTFSTRFFYVIFCYIRCAFYCFIEWSSMTMETWSICNE